MTCGGFTPRTHSKVVDVYFDSKGIKEIHSVFYTHLYLLLVGPVAPWLEAEISVPCSDLLAQQNLSINKLRYPGKKKRTKTKDKNQIKK